MTKPVSRQWLLERASALGFSAGGVVPAEPSHNLTAYLAWIHAGYQAGLYYMDRPDRVVRRRDLQQVLPGARSILSVALDYRSEIDPNILSDRSRGRVAVYAWGRDYHVVLRDRLRLLVADLKRMGHKAAVYVDFGALLERSHAQQAGLGFVGKNTMLIHPRRGSYFFLGEIITTAVFDAYDVLLSPAPGCGRCTRCLVACPTDAFPRPFVLDANRCISYHTIENPGWIPRGLRAAFGNWVFGCDVCQEVCPWNRFAPLSRDSAFDSPLMERAAPMLAELLRLDEARYQALYEGTPVMQIGRHRLVRNACVAAGNSANPALLPDLYPLLADADSLVRGHAAWAVWRLAGWCEALDARLSAEHDDGVLSELAELASSQ